MHPLPRRRAQTISKRGGLTEKATIPNTGKKGIGQVRGGVTSGYSPLAAVLAPKEITDALDPCFTFSGHPAARAAALANIEILTDENLPANAAPQGKYSKQILSSEHKESEIVGGIRGKGLLLSSELVKDRNVQERFSNPSAVAEAFKPIFMEHKILRRVGPRFD